MKINNMRRLIREVLEPIGMYSVNAEELLVLTAAVESLGGDYLYQTKGPARGFFQMEPETEKDIIRNYVFYKSELREVLSRFIQFNVDGSWKHKVANPLTYNLEYQVIMTRIHYLRRIAPIPMYNDIKGLAKYWKEHYNTKLGKGTVEGAIEKYINYVRGV